MGRKYNDVGTGYAYERELERAGYVKDWTFLDNRDAPNDFVFPSGKINGWIMRKAIAEWAMKHDYEKGYFLIVRGSGYWKDLHGFPYELWIRKGRYSNTYKNSEERFGRVLSH
jgi:hypothetical protein